MVFKLTQWGADPVSLFFMLIFLPSSLFAYYALPSIYRKEALVGISILYIILVSPWQIPLIFMCIGSSYLLMRQLQALSKRARYSRRIIIFICIGINFMFWIIFGVHSWHQGLPYLLGGSVFPLLTVDTALYLYRKPKKPVPPLMDFLAYCLFFPRLYLGPLESYYEFWKDGLSREQAGENLWKGCKKLIRGAFQYQFLGVRLLQLGGQISDFYQGEITTLSTWSLIIAEALGIYHVLRGFTGIAVGVGEMFFIQLPRDEGSPLSKETVRDSLKAIHKTSLQFFTRNIYVPLGKISKAPLFKVLASIITGGFIGLWIDFNWGMLLWGMILGFGIYLQDCMNAKYSASSFVNKGMTGGVFVIAFVFLTLGRFNENKLLAGSLLPLQEIPFANNQIIFLLMSQWIVLVISVFLMIPKVLELPKQIKDYFPDKLQNSLEIVSHVILGLLVAVLII